MKILDAVKERRSIRKFLPKKIPDTIIENLKDALTFRQESSILSLKTKLKKNLQRLH